MKVVVDDMMCEGYGKCERIAPEIFKLDDSGIARVLVTGDLTPEQEEAAKSAARVCPVDAIAIIE